MLGLLIFLGLIALAFIATIAFGAPFLPTRRQRVADAFELLNLKSGQTLLDLGSGDGRILHEAARRGIHAIGYEINPLLAWYSRLLCLRYRRLVQVRNTNYWHEVLPAADGVYIFLAEPYMDRMAAKLSAELPRRVPVVSFAFEFSKLHPRHSERGMHLYYFGK
jgi:hypothetical protein